MSAPIEHHVLPLPTDTAYVNMEGRQYKLFNFDLGEGIPRRKIAVGSLFFGAWFVLMIVPGVPLMWKGGPAFYLMVPGLLVFLALREEAAGRPTYALWWDWARFQPRRFQPVVPRIRPAKPQARIRVRAAVTVIDTSPKKKKGHRP